MAKTAIYAVLTGDLIQSTEMSPDLVGEVRRTMDDAAHTVAEWREGLVVGGPEFFRGDAWQLALDDPRMFLRVALYLRARLRAMKPQTDTRIAVGLGPAHVERQVSLSTGAAFVRSGRKLDSMEPWRLLAADTGDTSETMGALDALLAVCGAVAARWKPKQALIASLALDPRGMTQVEMARNLGMTQQGISDALVSSDYRVLAEAVAWVEGLDWTKRVGAAG